MRILINHVHECRVGYRDFSVEVLGRERGKWAWLPQTKETLKLTLKRTLKGTSKGTLKGTPLRGTLTPREAELRQPCATSLPSRAGA